jgi:UDP:flavonoid glycosyltransferase YjiC (YdhE family)
MSTTRREKPLLLVFPFGILAHYLRCLVLCRNLKNYFDIRILYDESFASFIAQENVSTFDCKGINSGSAVEAVRQFDFSWMNKAALEQMYLEQVEIIRELKPIAVLGDYSLTLKMAAEASSVLYISLLNGYMSKYYAGYRTISRTHPAYPLLKKVPTSIARMLTERGEASAFRQLHKPFKSLRRQYNLQPRKVYLDELEGDITLICDLEDLFPQKNLPPEYRLISPLYYESGPSVPGIADKIDPVKKTILASMGSTGDWQNLSFLNSGFYTRYNIVAAGDHTRVLHSDHVIHVPFVNIHDLYPYVDLIICHGGNGTIYQALLYQIPLLCKSSHCEQEWNIQALEEKQLGKSLDDITNPEDYKTIVEEWLRKKGTHPYTQYSDLIKARDLRLPEMIKVISEMILRNSPAGRDSEATQLLSTM